MAEIKIEKVSKEELDSLGVSNWSPWECEPSTFDWEYTFPETAYILEGKVKIKTEKGEVEISKGDLVHFPKGLKCRWDVIEKIRKVYTFK
ncbi:MAG: cupin domain-containing protein [bacterium]|nr:cupin domain-containing protein [bacterium]